MSETSPARTHNLPSLKEMFDPKVIDSLIVAEIDPLKMRATELVASCQRFSEAYPTIETAEQDAKATEVIAVCARFTTLKTGRADAARVALKAPLLAASQAIDGTQGSPGPFAKVIGSVKDAVQRIHLASIAYKQRVEDEIRKSAQAEADRLAAQSRLAEQLASSGSGLVTMDDAANAARAAEKYQVVADSKAADLTRTRGGDVGTSSLRYKRVVTVTSPADVPRMYCVPDLAALTRAAGKAGTPIPVIAGCVISDVPDLTVRR